MISAASAQIEASERPLTVTSLAARAQATETPSAGGDNLRKTVIRNGVPEKVPDYATVSAESLLLRRCIRSMIVCSQVQGILLGCVATFVIFITIVGPECVVFLPWLHGLRNLHSVLPGIMARTLSGTRPLSKRAQPERTRWLMKRTRAGVLKRNFCRTRRCETEGRSNHY
jgi:hypothetical protein